MQVLTLTDSQQVVLGPVTGVDKKGNPATIVGPLVWAPSDPAMLAVTPSTDGLSVNVAALGPLGNAQVTVTDSSNGATGVLALQVVGGAETAISIPAGTPTEQ